MLKPRSGRGSRGVAVVHDADGFASAVAANPYPLQALIQQEYVDGPEFTVSVTVSGDGTVLGVVPKEIIVKKGITWVAVSSPQRCDRPVVPRYPGKAPGGRPVQRAAAVGRGRPTDGVRNQPALLNHCHTDRRGRESTRCAL